LLRLNPKYTKQLAIWITFYTKIMPPLKQL